MAIFDQIWVGKWSKLRLVYGISVTLVRIGTHPYWSDSYTVYLYGLNSSHSIFDPHQLFSSQVSPKFTPELSGLHSIFSTWGFKSTLDLSYSTLTVSILILIYLLSNLSSVYMYKYTKSYRLPMVLGFLSILWSAHIIHVSIPIVSGCTPSLSHLSLVSGIIRSNISIPLGDMCHHHLAVGILILIIDYISINTNKNNRVRIRGILRSPFSTNSNIRLSILFIFLSLLCALTSQQLSTLVAYSILSYNYIIYTTLYIHHIWISSLLFTGAISHIGISISNTSRTSSIVYSIISHKYSILSTLSWISLFLGFHTLLIYVHNDTVLAFGIPSKQISIEPTWVQILQGRSGKISPIAISTYSAWANSSVSSSILYIGPGDLLSHHGISLGLHTTQLILTKSVLDVSGTILLPDKYNIGYGYSCDGPGRGGTCDISTWDGIYLGSFWVLNLGGWVTFYYHWKHITIWQGSPSLFDEGSTYLNGYFRDYLWFNSGPLIKGYDSIATTDLSVAS